MSDALERDRHREEVPDAHVHRADVGIAPGINHLAREGVRPPGEEEREASGCFGERIERAPNPGGRQVLERRLGLDAMAPETLPEELSPAGEGLVFLRLARKRWRHDPTVDRA